MPATHIDRQAFRLAAIEFVAMLQQTALVAPTRPSAHLQHTTVVAATEAGLSGYGMRRAHD